MTMTSASTVSKELYVQLWRSPLWKLDIITVHDRLTIGYRFST